MKLVEASIEFAPEIFAFLKENPSEMGFENGFEDWNYESFFAYGIASMIDSANGVNLKKGHVPQTYCFLMEGREVLGCFKIRHYLVPSLRSSSAGHIGYMIAKKHRGHGYAKIGLKLAIEKLKSLPDFDDEYILLGCRADNIASLKTQLACGGKLYKIENGHCFTLFELDPKEHLPILDYFPENASKTQGERQETLPPKMVICFFADAIAHLLEEGKIRQILTLKGENEVPIYLFEGTDICLMPGIIGEPAVGGFTEECIFRGVKEIVFVGGAGSLVPHPLGELFVVKEALRDEGYSYSYLPAGIRAKANRAMMRRIEAILKEEGIFYQEACAWTTDCFYRENQEAIEARIAQGAELVDMEQAGLIAMALYRGIDYGAILYSGDDLSGEGYDKRNWTTLSELRNKMVQIAVKVLEER